MNEIVDNQTPLVSVIVPVYNTAVYLEQCLNSLLNQTLRNIEIIVIDDGSTDESGKICDDFSKIDKRIIVIHKENEGLSAARNNGLDIARAKYVMFVDSDDWVEPDFCELPYQMAEKNKVSMVIFPFFLYDSFEGTKTFPKRGIACKEEVFTNLWEFTEDYAWNKLYRTELFKGIRYPIGRLYEDISVTYRLIGNTDFIYLLDKRLYHYREHRAGSITSDKSYKTMADYASSSFEKIDDLKKWGYNCKMLETQISWLYLIYMGRFAFWSERCKTFFKNVWKLDLDYTIFSWKHLALFYIYKVSPQFFDFILFAVPGLRTVENGIQRERREPA